MSLAHTPDRATLVDIYRRMALIQRSDEQVPRRHQVRQDRRAVLLAARPGSDSRRRVGEPHDRRLHLHDLSRHPRHARQGRAAEGLCGPRSPARSTGTCKGKGGPMHITHPAIGRDGHHRHRRRSMPIANGLAWASQLAARSASRSPTSATAPRTSARSTRR